MRVVRLFVQYIFRLGPLNFFSYLYQRFVSKKELILINVPGLSQKVAMRNHTSDIPLFTEMFIQKEYKLPTNGEIKTIIDCGANVGFASLYFLTAFPKAHIISIEPAENNFILLKKNTSAYNNINCINKGVWDKTANLQVIDPGWGNHSFTVQEVQAPTNNSISAISIADLMGQFNLSEIDILKIDIEGSEEQVLLSSTDWIKKVKMIFCEIHENLKPGLTEKIKTLLLPDFDFFIKGEYHVFISKGNLS